MNRRGTRVHRLALALLPALGGLTASAGPPPPSPPPGEREAVGRFVERFCVECHNGDDRAGGLDLESIGPDDTRRRPEVWEGVVRKLVARQMPPDGAVRPKGATTDAVVSTLTAALDRAAAE